MADKTFVGGGGIIYRAEAGTEFPAITNGISGYGTALTSAGFVEVGEVAEDGLTFGNSIEKAEVKNWYGSVLRVLYTGHTETFTFNSLDFVDFETQKSAFGSNNVEQAAAATNDHGAITKISFTGKAPEACAWCIVMADGDKTAIFQIEKGQTEVGEIQFTKDDVAKTPITLTAVKGSGDATVVMLTDDGVKSA